MQFRNPGPALTRRQEPDAYRIQEFNPRTTYHDKPFPSNHEIHDSQTEAFCPQRQCVTDLRLILNSLLCHAHNVCPGNRYSTVSRLGSSCPDSEPHSFEYQFNHSHLRSRKPHRALAISIIHLVALHRDFQNLPYSISISIKTLLRALFHHLLSQLCSLRSH